VVSSQADERAYLEALYKFELGFAELFLFLVLLGILLEGLLDERHCLCELELLECL
jgi:hypothetical protein